ncbi:MAG TPA: STAS domain-containing protein [Roseiflexaceae bacterium]|nr:STAS domain-containing protein [Roseiflexaceae bacterium]
MTQLMLQPAPAAPSKHHPEAAETYDLLPHLALVAGLPMHHAILDALPMGIMLYHVVSRNDFRIAFLNRASAQGYEEMIPGLIGKPFDVQLPPETAVKVLEHFQSCVDSGAPVEIEDSFELPIGRIWTRSKYLPLRSGSGPVTHILLTWEDITAQKQREQDELARQQEIIQSQAAALEELSTPLLAISATTVVLPLVGAIDSQRAQQLLTTLLDGVAERRAKVVILDITGVPIVDTQVANVFLQASQAVALLGAQVVITGIRPEVAQTIVGLGIDLQRIITRNTLQDGIAFALQR